MGQSGRGRVLPSFSARSMKGSHFVTDFPSRKSGNYVLCVCTRVLTRVKNRIQQVRIHAFIHIVLVYRNLR